MRKLSILNHSKTLDQVLEDQILYAIDTFVRRPPYIVNVSKKQLWWGNGSLFKYCPDEYIKKGFLANTGYRIPSNDAMARAKRQYGYEALVAPWSILNAITNKVIRHCIMKRELDGGDLDDIRVLLGKGYVREDGTLNPDQTQGISVYFIMASDNEYREKQQEWLQSHTVEKGNMWVRYQFLRNQLTHPDYLIERKRGASKLVNMNNQLLGLKEYEELDPMVDRNLLPWVEEE